jgi:hypothetical protein
MRRRCLARARHTAAGLVTVWIRRHRRQDTGDCRRERRPLPMAKGLAKVSVTYGDRSGATSVSRGGKTRAELPNMAVFPTIPI